MVDKERLSAAVARKLASDDVKAKAAAKRAQDEAEKARLRENTRSRLYQYDLDLKAAVASINAEISETGVELLVGKSEERSSLLSYISVSARQAGKPMHSYTSFSLDEYGVNTVIVVIRGSSFPRGSINVHDASVGTYEKILEDFIDRLFN